MSEENTENWLDLLHYSADNITVNVRMLQELSLSLKRVGLEKPATEIMEISWELLEAKKSILKATNMKLSSDVKSAEAMSGAVLNATLAGCIVGGKQKGKVVKKK